ncbi:MAG TPA: hypothetical protein VFD39_12000, partial [Trueperaceae bacterium]|nr:hypothetical protein [Trueperaceae bacterium]
HEGGIALSRLSAGESFPALLSQAYAFSLADAARKRTMMANYLRLARAVPVFRLDYPTGLNHLDEICGHVERLADAEADGNSPARAE